MGSVSASPSSAIIAGSSAGACLTNSERARLNELIKKSDDGINLTNDEMNELYRLERRDKNCETQSEERLHDFRLNATMYNEYDVRKFLEGKFAEFERLPAGNKVDYKKHDGLDFSFPSWLFHTHTMAPPDTSFCDGKRLCSYGGVLNIKKTGDARVDAQILLALQSIIAWSSHAKDFIEAFNNAFVYAQSMADSLVRDLTIFKQTQQRAELRQKESSTIFSIVTFGALMVSTLAGGAELAPLFGTLANEVVLANSLYGVWKETPQNPTEDVAAILKYEMSRVFNATHNYFRTESANILGGKKDSNGIYIFSSIMQQPSILEWFSSDVNKDYEEPIKQGVLARIVHGILGILQEASIMAVWLLIHCESPAHWGYKKCFAKADYWRIPEDPFCFSGHG